MDINQSGHQEKEWKRWQEVINNAPDSTQGLQNDIPPKRQRGPN